MSRLRFAWLSALPLAAAGSLAAHQLAFRLVEPDARTRAGALAATGHAYLGHAPVALAGGLGVLVVALAAHAWAACRGRATARVPAWPFALLAPVGFAVQEHLERLVATGRLPLDTALEPAFLAGLALQLPFAVVAYLVARALVRTAETLGHALGPLAPRPALASASLAWRPTDAAALPLSVPALARRKRAPPR